jgi:hypothetical protein
MSSISATPRTTQDQKILNVLNQIDSIRNAAPRSPNSLLCSRKAHASLELT